MIYSETSVTLNAAIVLRPGACYNAAGTCFTNNCNNGLDSCPLVNNFFSTVTRGSSKHCNLSLIHDTIEHSPISP